MALKKVWLFWDTSEEQCEHQRKYTTVFISSTDQILKQQKFSIIKHQHQQHHKIMFSTILEYSLEQIRCNNICWVGMNGHVLAHCAFKKDKEIWNRMKVATGYDVLTFSWVDIKRCNILKFNAIILLHIRTGKVYLKHIFLRCLRKVVWSGQSTRQ